jgi:hypothetical protein
MIPIDEKHIIKKLKAGEHINTYMIIIMLLSANLVIIS